MGDFNKSRIIVNGDHVEHWLNGMKVVSLRSERDKGAGGAAQFEAKRGGSGNASDAGKLDQSAEPFLGDVVREHPHPPIARKPLKCPLTFSGPLRYPCWKLRSISHLL